MTFVNVGFRAFLDESAMTPLRRRSEGRLKSYLSTEDIRTWNLRIEDRRKQILDTVNSEVTRCKGNLSKEILMCMRNKHMQEVRRCCRMMWLCVQQLDLSEDDSSKIKCLEHQLGATFRQTVSGCACGDNGLLCPCSTCSQPIKCSCGKADCECGKEKEPTKLEATEGKVSTKTVIKPGQAGTSGGAAKGGASKGEDSTKICECVKDKMDDKLCAEGQGKKVRGKSLAKGQTGSAKSSGPPKVDICTLYESIIPNKANIMRKKLTLNDSKKNVKVPMDILQDNNLSNQQIAIRNINNEQKLLEKLLFLQNVDKVKLIKDTGEFDGFEFETIKTELENLSRYCTDLLEIEEENHKLKKELQLLKQKFPKISNDSEGTNFSTIIEERDNLKNQVKELEDQLKQQKILMGDVEIYKERSAMFSKLLAERDELLKSLERTDELQKEVNWLRLNSNRIGELERELKTLKSDKTNQLDVQRVKSECNCLKKEVANLKSERDALKKRVDCLNNDKNFLASKTKEAEILKTERDKLQISLSELPHLKTYNENLRLKCEKLQSDLKECKDYKHKYEEILDMQRECQMWKSKLEESEMVNKECECLKKQVDDLENVIVDQENEIKKQLCHFEQIIIHKGKCQSRLRDALNNMRIELEQKNHLIAIFEERLAKVEEELESSIQGVCCEKMCYQTRLEKLQAELNKANKTIESLEAMVNQSKKMDHDEEKKTLDIIRKELDHLRMENEKLLNIRMHIGPFEGDEHLKSMLIHSESAIKKVLKELSKQYKDWDRCKSRCKWRGRSLKRSETKYFELTENNKTHRAVGPNPRQRSKSAAYM